LNRNLPSKWGEISINRKDEMVAGEKAAGHHAGFI
jgi:hypothetical protein